MINTDCLCVKCREKIPPFLRKRRTRGIEINYLYDYNQGFKECLRQYKELNDYVLYSVFLDRVARKLKKIFKECIIVPVPSSLSAVEKRGFRHVNLVFSTLGLEVFDCLFKIEQLQQKQLSKAQRSEIRFTGENLEYLNNKRVLLVDDVSTTGSSIINAYTLLASHCASIDVLVLSVVEER